MSEKISLQAIQQLVRKSYQALALWKLLCEHQFTVIVGELQKVGCFCSCKTIPLILCSVCFLWSELQSYTLVWWGSFQKHLGYDKVNMS